MADSASGTPVPKPLTVPAPTAVTVRGPASPVPPNIASTPLAASFPSGTNIHPEDSTPRSSVAVGLHEAALDSPSFRASAVLFGEQIDSIERWLESYAKSTSKLVHDFAGLEDSINSYLSKIVPPPGAADGLIDSDHTLLALKRVSDGTRDWWSQVTYALRRVETCNAEPIRNFLNAELRSFKETRRALEQSQKQYDTTLARYVSQSKAKEPSALREDAFSVYETRRAYLKSSMDFCQMAPQLRSSLDKLLTRVSADFWRDMKRTRDTAASPAKWGNEMERIRGWAKEIELSESTLRRELQMARRMIGETTLAAIKPSRELDDYSTSTVPYLGSRGPSTVRPDQDNKAVISEKQGWLFLRTVTGKPARVNWVHRWFYCRDGIFGYLVQGPQGVLQGDDIGVLLCSAKPAVQEDRRFCFEVKTKSQNLILQAETQGQLTEWLEVFEVAKRKAFEASMARDNASSPIGGMDPAFSITPPSVPDFSARALDAAPLGTVEEGSAPHQTLAQSNTLPIPVAGPDGGLMTRSSFDVGPAGPPRRSITMLGQELRREEGESRGEHASRLMQRLDLHRKATFGSGAAGGDPFGPGGSGSGNGNGNGNNNGGGNGGGGPPSAGAAPGQAGAGIASLISSTHGTLPGYPQGSTPNVHMQGAGGIPPAQRPYMQAMALGDSRRGSLAPTTYAKAPILTFLSKVAVNVSSERSLCRAGSAGSLPSGVLANYWGSQLWGSGFVSRGHGYSSQDLHTFETAGSSIPHSPSSPNPVSPSAPGGGHRKTLSVDAAKSIDPRGANHLAPEMFPVSYPMELRAQHAQFRLLFPSVPMEEKLVLVFNAAWSSASESGTENQGLIGSGRVYVTPDNMYFYSQTMGLVVTYAVSLDIITEVTSAPGKDCDYTFLHLSQDLNETGFTRITIKTFLEDMYILQARLNLLIDDLQAAEPMEVSDILVALHNIVGENNGRGSPSIGSWDQYGGLGGSGSPPYYDDGGTPTGRNSGRYRQLQNDAGGRRVTSYGSKGSGIRPFPAFPSKLQLPSHAIVYEPTDMQKKVGERHFEISAKACFHVLFGDKSFIFPKLYFDRQARNIEQGPWTLADQGKMKRQFVFKAEAVDMIGRKKDETVSDEQTIDVFSDHITYVVTYVKTAWHLPHSQAFKQITKVVITHVAKSKCKLAIFVKVDWSKAPAFSKNLVERQALDDASRDAEELAELATDEVRKLGAHSRTKRAIQVYGNIGTQTKAVLFSPGEHGHGGGSASGKQVRSTPRTLTDMVLETVRSFMESVVTSLVMWAFAGCRKLFHVASAQRILLAVLALSIMANVLFSSRETSAWWTERHAVTYMGKLGVGPNMAMSKSIYLADLESASHAVTPRQTRSPNSTEGDSVCYDTFLSIANATDLDAPHDDAGALLLSPSSRTTARRLRRTRQKLASYRHDLVVAMRVVNSVEREMVQSEWENWLYDETWRCEQVYEMILRQGQNSTDAEDTQSQSKSPIVAERLALLAHWHKDYCGSCQADQRALEELEWRQSLV